MENLRSGRRARGSPRPENPRQSYRRTVRATSLQSRSTVSSGPMEDGEAEKPNQIVPIWRALRSAVRARTVQVLYRDEPDHSHGSIRSYEQCPISRISACSCFRVTVWSGQTGRFWVVCCTLLLEWCDRLSQSCSASRPGRTISGRRTLDRMRETVNIPLPCHYATLPPSVTRCDGSRARDDDAHRIPMAPSRTASRHASCRRA